MLQNHPSTTSRAYGTRANRNHTGRRGNEGIREEAERILGGIAATSRTALADEGIDPREALSEAAAAKAEVDVLRAEIRETEETIKRAEGKAWRKVEAPSDLKRATLADVIADWAKRTSAPGRHVQQYEYPAQRFRELHGNLPVAEINKTHIREFTDKLMALPHSTAKEVREGDIHAAIRYGEANKLPRLTTRTVNKHLTALGTLLRYASDHGFTETQAIARVPLLKVKRKTGDKGRLPFTPEQTKTIFETLEAKFPKHDSADFWIPFLAAYHGMRREEMCQLTKTDLRKVDGVWAIDINDDDDKRLKNAGARRIIPLHPRLQEMGFPKFAQASKGPRLFGALKQDKDGRFGGPYGKRFMRLLREVIKITDRRLTFHSMRHTWKDAARNAGLPPDVRDRIQGHQHESAVSASYGTGHSVAALTPWMAKIDPLTAGTGAIVVDADDDDDDEDDED